MSENINFKRLSRMVNDLSRLSFRDVFPIINEILVSIGYDDKIVRTLSTLSCSNPRKIHFTVAKDSIDYSAELIVGRDLTNIVIRDASGTIVKEKTFTN